MKITGYTSKNDKCFPFQLSLFVVVVVVVAHQCGSLPLYFLCCRELGLVPLEFASNFKPLSRIIERLYSFSVRYRSNCYEKLPENFIFFAFSLKLWENVTLSSPVLLFVLLCFRDLAVSKFNFNFLLSISIFCNAWD